MALTPLAFIISPSKLNMPIDLTLGVLFPFHAHFGLNAIISDYLPKVVQTPARFGLMGCTLVATAGLLKLNLTGCGLTESLKSLWRKPQKKD